jgi:hypothetical protein
MTQRLPCCFTILDPLGMKPCLTQAYLQALTQHWVIFYNQNTHRFIL